MPALNQNSFVWALIRPPSDLATIQFKQVARVARGDPSALYANLWYHPPGAIGGYAYEFNNLFPQIGEIVKLWDTGVNDGRNADNKDRRYHKNACCSNFQATLPQCNESPFTGVLPQYPSLVHCGFTWQDLKSSAPGNDITQVADVNQQGTFDLSWVDDVSFGNLASISGPGLYGETEFVYTYQRRPSFGPSTYYHTTMRWRVGIIPCQAGVVNYTGCEADGKMAWGDDPTLGIIWFGLYPEVNWDGNPPNRWDGGTGGGNYIPYYDLGGGNLRGNIDGMNIASPPSTFPAWPTVPWTPGDSSIFGTRVGITPVFGLNTTCSAALWVGGSQFGGTACP
jgi:hypothetical protein